MSQGVASGAETLAVSALAAPECRTILFCTCAIVTTLVHTLVLPVILLMPKASIATAKGQFAAESRT